MKKTIESLTPTIFLFGFIAILAAVFLALNQGLISSWCTPIGGGGTFPEGWWNESWAYRQEVNISEVDCHGDLSNWAVPITITRQTGMAAYFQDVRFTYYDEGLGYEVPMRYWIEPETNDSPLNSWAQAWVLAPSIPDCDELQVYMYWGNPTAVFEGDGESVFVFFDDFEDEHGGINLAKWNNSHFGFDDCQNNVLPDGRRYLEAYNSTSKECFLFSNPSLPMQQEIFSGMYLQATAWDEVSPYSEYQWCYDGGPPVWTSLSYSLSLTFHYTTGPEPYWGDTMYENLPMPMGTWHSTVKDAVRPGSEIGPYYRWHITHETGLDTASRNWSSPMSYLINASENAPGNAIALYTVWSDVEEDSMAAYDWIAVKDFLGLGREPYINYGDTYHGGTEEYTYDCTNSSAGLIVGNTSEALLRVGDQLPLIGTLLAMVVLVSVIVIAFGSGFIGGGRAG